MDRTARRPWSNLPPEILSMIGRRLDARMDVLRFRSVCSSFRSSIPSPPRNASRFPCRNPHLLSSSVFLCESTICVLETPDEASDSGAPSPPRSRWLVKLQESNLGDIQLLSLFSHRRIIYLPPGFPKVIDSLEFRIVEICREYRLEDNTSGIFPGIRKLVVSPDCVWTDLNELEVYSLQDEGRLGYWKYGDECWTYLDDQRGCSYNDIIVYEGKVCVVDRFGAVSWIDSSFRTRNFLPSIGSEANADGSRGYFKHLVTSCGDLYLVDRYLSRNPGVHPDVRETCDFRVYRLDRQCGKWAEVESLGNMAFFLSKHCSYAFSTQDLGGCNGNCIYFMKHIDFSLSQDKVDVFSLDDRGIRPLVFSYFITQCSSDLTRPKSSPSGSKEYMD